MSIITELWGDAKFIFQFRNRHRRVQKQLDRNAPKRGDLAPNFTLHDVSGQRPVTLSDLCGKKPVVLIFGSFT